MKKPSFWSSPLPPRYGVLLFLLIFIPGFWFIVLPKEDRSLGALAEVLLPDDESGPPVRAIDDTIPIPKRRILRGERIQEFFTRFDKTRPPIPTEPIKERFETETEFLAKQAAYKNSKNSPFVVPPAWSVSFAFDVFGSVDYDAESETWLISATCYALKTSADSGVPLKSTLCALAVRPKSEIEVHGSYVQVEVVYNSSWNLKLSVGQPAVAYFDPEKQSILLKVPMPLEQAKTMTGPLSLLFVGRVAGPPGHHSLPAPGAGVRYGGERLYYIPFELDKLVVQTQGTDKKMAFEHKFNKSNRAEVK